MRENGVYDNTRIIIVSDHGAGLGQFEDLIVNMEDGTSIDAEAYNALLLFKDFACNDPFQSEATFMSNADVPVLAMQGLFEDMKNPFTDDVISDKIKKAGLLALVYRDNVTETTFNDPDGYCYVSGNIFDPGCWSLGK